MATAKTLQITVDTKQFDDSIKKVLVSLGVIQDTAKKTESSMGKILTIETARAAWDAAKAVFSMVQKLGSAAAEGAKLLEQQRAYARIWGEAGKGLDEIIEKNSRYALSLAESQAVAIKLKEANLDRAQIEDVSASTAAIAAAHYMDQATALDVVVKALQGGKATALLKLGFTKEETAELKTQGDLQAALLLKAAALGEAGKLQVSEAAAFNDAIGDVGEEFSKFLASNKEALGLLGGMADLVNSISSGFGAAYTAAVGFAEQLLRAKDYAFYLGTMGIFSAAGRGAMDVDASRRTIASKASPGFDTAAAQATIVANQAALAAADSAGRANVALHTAMTKAAALFGTGGKLGAKTGGGRAAGGAGEINDESSLAGTAFDGSGKEWRNPEAEAKIADFNAAMTLLSSNMSTMSEDFAKAWAAADAPMKASADRQRKYLKDMSVSFQEYVKLADLGKAGIDAVASSTLSLFEDLASGSENAGAKFLGNLLSTLGRAVWAWGLAGMVAGLFGTATMNYAQAGAGVATFAAAMAVGALLSGAGAAVSSSAGGGGAGGSGSAGGGSATSFSSVKDYTEKKKEEVLVQVQVYTNSIVGSPAELGIVVNKALDAARKKNMIK